MADVRKVGRPKGTLQIEEVRNRIRVSQLINRLELNGLGEPVMTSSQVDSAKFLINKAMPNPPETIVGPGKEGQHKLDITLSFK